jgi:hypothetical protein
MPTSSGRIPKHTRVAPKKGVSMLHSAFLVLCIAHSSVYAEADDKSDPTPKIEIHLLASSNGAPDEGLTLRVRPKGQLRDLEGHYFEDDNLKKALAKEDKKGVKILRLQVKMDDDVSTLLDVIARIKRLGDPAILYELYIFPTK